MISNILESILIKVALIIFLTGLGSYGILYGYKGPHWNSQNIVSRNTFVFPFHSKGGQFQGHLPGGEFYTKPVPRCPNTTFCEKPSYYPDDLVNFAVEKDNKFKYSATVEEIDDSDSKNNTDLTHAMPICDLIVKVVYPKTAQNRYKRWLFVINHEKFLQGVRIEACRNGDSNTLTYINIPLRHRIRCKQLYTYRRLAAILPNGTIKVEAFRFPSGCKGYLKLAVTNNE